MNKILPTKIEEFLSVFKSQAEIGLLIFSLEEERQKTGLTLVDRGFVLASDWLQVLSGLENKQSVALTLSEKLTPEIYSLIAQYSDRAGEIQIMNPLTMVLAQVEFEPRSAQLLLLVTETKWKKIDEELNLKSKVGLIERIK